MYINQEKKSENWIGRPWGDGVKPGSEYGKKWLQSCCIQLNS
jgi:hypothetical protein